MATYGNMVLTTAGQALYAAVQSGTQLKFTRMQIGGGQLGFTDTLASALVSGTVYTSLTVGALAYGIASGSSIVIGSGATTQTVTTSASTAAGATNISVTSYTANATYAVGASITLTADETQLTALIDPISYFNINSISTASSTAQINALYQNTSLAVSTYTSEIGLFADNASGTEILYAYANAALNGDTIPPYSDGPFSRQFQINTAVGSATNVTATIPIDTYVLASSVGVASGVSSLDATGNVPLSELGNVPTVPTATTTTPGTVEISVAPASGTPIAVTTADTGNTQFTNYLRTDSGAPNPQVVANPVNFSYGVNEVAIGNIADFNGNSYALGVGAPASPGTWPFGVVVGGGTNGKVAFAVSTVDGVQTLHNILDDGSGNATFAGSVTATEFIGSGVGLTNILRTDSGAPNPQTVENPVDFSSLVTLTGTENNTYYGINKPISQPSNSGGVQLFRNSNSGNSVDLTISTFRVIPNNGSSYPSPSFNLDGSGNLTAAGTVTAASGQLGSASGEWTPSAGTFNVAAGTVINVASVPSGAKMYNVMVTAGTNTGEGAIGMSEWNGNQWMTNATSNSFLYGISIGQTDSVQGTALTLYDGSYYVQGYFKVNVLTGYLQFMTTQSPTANANTASTSSWTVS